MGCNDIIKSILTGTYIYCHELDAFITATFQDTATVYQSMSPADFSCFVTANDFQAFWTLAKKVPAQSFGCIFWAQHSSCT